MIPTISVANIIDMIEEAMRIGNGTSSYLQFEDYMCIPTYSYNIICLLFPFARCEL